MKPLHRVDYGFNHFIVYWNQHNVAIILGPVQVGAGCAEVDFLAARRPRAECLCQARRPARLSPSRS